ILPTGKAFVDVPPGAGSIRTGGHGLRTDNPTPSASKSSSNGQFVPSQVTWSTLIPARSSFYESTSSPVEAETSASTYIVPSHGFLPMKAPSMKTSASLGGTSSALKSWDREKKDPTWLSSSSFSSLPLSEGDQGAGAFSTFSTLSPPEENTPGGTPAPTDRLGQVFKKPSNMNLLRKLWSSTRTAKLNLTHEHQSILRIESKPSSTDRDDVQIGPSSPSSQMPAPGSTRDALGVDVAVFKEDGDDKEGKLSQSEQAGSTKSTNSSSKISPESLILPITLKPSLG
ncbi:unnamed protein product, partial [Allacma fusca]